ncbi:hypothetical protein [Mycobacterium sp. RTGN5]|uniref:hypothetical protein n=1 Tax=Mycobacterium sp. RTGN5 TaxID=3016522 RepID=UPI0029C97FFC|nr:hypothetical protein [Mycobacterium sp. RTGN5]
MTVVAVPHDAFKRWPAQPAHPADRAQARIFCELLREELDELETLAARARSARTEHSEVRLRQDMQRFNVRINELRGFLTALENRFSP